MNLENSFISIFRAINITETTEADALIRFNNLTNENTSNLHISFINIINKNITVLASKVKYLPDVIKPIQREHATFKWINNFYKTKFIDVEDDFVHTIESKYNEETQIVNSLMILHCINNKAASIHGSFAVYLLNNQIKYSDIDISSADDYFILITIMAICEAILDRQYIILVIPYIINHRKLAPFNDSHTTISDVLHVDRKIVEDIKLYKIRKGSNNNKFIFQISNPVMQFFNYFKMFQLEDRRKRIELKKDNHRKLLNTIFDYTLDVLHLNSIDRIKSYNIRYDITSQNIIKLLLDDDMYYLINNCPDNEFNDFVKNNIDENNNSYLAVYTQASSIIPDQYIKHITIDPKTNKTHIIHYINYSRNVVYKLDSTTLADMSLLSILSLIGSIDFWLAKTIKSSYTQTIRKKYVRIIKTIQMIVIDYVTENVELLYDRTKNTKRNSGHQVVSLRTKTNRGIIPNNYNRKVIFLNSNY